MTQKYDIFFHFIKGYIICEITSCESKKKKKTRLKIIILSKNETKKGLKLIMNLSVVYLSLEIDCLFGMRNLSSLTLRFYQLSEIDRQTFI